MLIGAILQKREGERESRRACVKKVGGAKEAGNLRRASRIQREVENRGAGAG